MTSRRLAYGVVFRSHWQLPGPEASKGYGPEIELRRAGPLGLGAERTHLSNAPEAEVFARHVRVPDGADYLVWSHLFEFLISRDGLRIEGHPLSQAFSDSFPLSLFGSVVSYALLKLGIESLHATAIGTNDGAIGFVGDSGFGKSTLAASFLQAGWQLLTDDLLALKPRGNSLLVQPGLPKISLRREVADLLLGTSSPDAIVNPHLRKVVVPLEAARWSRRALPLQALYLLSPPDSLRSNGSDVVLRPLSKREAFIALTTNVFNSFVPDEQRLKLHFAWAGQLAASVRVIELSYPRSFGMLPTVREKILRDV
jgi:hypothetical protein